MTPEARRRLLTIGAVAFVLGIFIIPSLFNHKIVKTLIVLVAPSRREPPGRHGRDQFDDRRDHRSIDQWRQLFVERPDAHHRQ